MVIRVKISTLFWVVLTLPLFPLTILPWLSRKSDERNSSSLYAVAVVLAIGATVGVGSIYVMSVIDTSTVIEVAPPLSVEHGTKYEVTLDRHSIVRFLPWSWNYQKSYVRWVGSNNNTHTHDHTYWIDVETGESFLNHGLEHVFLGFMAGNLRSEQVERILAE